MMLRSAAVRHGRPVLAQQPATTWALRRRLSTQGRTTAAATAAAAAGGGGYMSGAGASGEPGAAAAHEAGGPAKGPVSSKKKKQKIVQEAIMSLGIDSSRTHRGGAWAKAHRVGREVLTPARQYAEFQRIQGKTRRLGSRVERRYVPTELVARPPGPDEVTLELLMASQTHIGHNTSLWNPANSRYIYGVRQGVHMIALEATAAHLRRAARVVEEVSYRGGIVVFVGTRKGQMELVTRAAGLAGACHLFTKWTPGAITNRDVILRAQATKVVDALDGELDGFDMFKGTARPLLPDLVVCLNPLENYTMLYECGLKSIPTIGVIDTNADPSWVTYTIPANDDRVSWSTAPELKRHMRKEAQAAARKRKEVMGRMQSDVEGFTEEEQEMLQSRYQGVAAAPEVTEADMVDMMGEAAAAAAAAAAQEHEAGDAPRRD